MHISPCINGGADVQILIIKRGKRGKEERKGNVRGNVQMGVNQGLIHLSSAPRMVRKSWGVWRGGGPPWE